ncbi:MAG: CHC2 zinc finger domain-containing protein [Candidatus Thiodiazotropha sp. 6PDIVS]
MTRIPEQEIERLKQEVSLQRLVGGMGITLKRHGSDLIGLCPFHDDKEPSLVISPEKNLWHCLGACQTGGSVIDWVMKAEGVSFRHAVELLLADYAPSLVADAVPVKRSKAQKLPTPLSSSAEDQTLLKQVVDYYHETLKNDAEGLAYLEKRGLNREALDHFKLGLANRSLGYRLPEKTRKAGAEIRGRLQALGILRDSGHEHFNGSLVIPVINGGQITEIYGRKLNDRLRKGTPLHLYLPGPHQGVFNLEGLSVSKEIILCESLIDVLTFWCAGFRNVTASYGIEGFTSDHLKTFKAYNTERVLIAYDRDAAGEAAAEKLAKQLMAEGIDCYRIHFPKGMDANEYALQVKPASKSLGVVIRSAVWMGKGEAPSKLEHQQVNEAQESFEPLPAKVIPDLPKPDISAEVKEDEVIICFGDRRYRIRGLAKNLSANQLKVNLLVNREAALHVDTFDLYAAKARGHYIKQAAIELGLKDTVIKADIGKVLLKCEALQEAQIRQTLEPKEAEVTLADDAREQALTLLKSPDLMQRILDDFHTAGVVGEETNKLVGYLAAVSRKLDKPLAIIIQSTSAAGKSSLMDAVLNLMPEEERVQYSAMTGQSLFYMGETNLKNKILAIAEEEGAENASYALKLLQSEGELTIASTGKDETTGSMVTKEYRVEGPVMLFLTTTAIDIDEELMNRCLVLTVNESREQTQAIHAMQRRQQTLEGLLQNEDRKQLIHLHRNAQRLLKPLLVANPFAEQLTFIDDKTRTRRDHMKYLTLIRSIALLHQYQREIKRIEHDGHGWTSVAGGQESGATNGQMLEYIEVTLKDIEIANGLAHEVLGRTLEELPPQTYTLLKHIKTMVTSECEKQEIEQEHYRFSRRDIREVTGWSDGQLKIHCSRLTDLEYLLVHRGGRGHSIVYELLYDGDLDDRKHLMGLIDVEKLRYDEKKSGVKPQKTASSQGQVRPKSGGCQGVENTDNLPTDKGLDDGEQENGPKTTIRPKKPDQSYRSHAPAMSAKGR